jgi:arylsulfatase A-like enzyme
MVAGLLALLLTAAAGCTKPTPHVVIIVVDTLRADRLGAYGNGRGLTPFLDALARRGTRFANAYATSSWTSPSVASLLTSRYPSQHGVNALDARIADHEVTLAESLAPRGYIGGGFSGNVRLDEAHGYAQGFAHWRMCLGPKGQLKPPARLLREASLAWVQPLRDQRPEAPVLLFLQFMEPHTPYRPVEPFRTRFVRGAVDTAREDIALDKLMALTWGLKRLTVEEIDLLASLYDGEVATIDAELAIYFDELERAGVLPNALVVITADHGEEFAEHGEVLHGNTLFEPAIRVPLIIAGPGVPVGRVVEEPVSLIDVGPTLLELVGVARPEAWAGRSLVGRMTAPAAGHAPSAVVSELAPLGGRDFRVHERTVIAGPNKLLQKPDGNAVAYNLDDDPGEQRPRDASTPPFVALGVRLDALRSAWARSGPQAAAPTVDDATKEKLRALGYHP